MSHPAPPLDNVLDLLLDAVCVVDREGRYLFVSAAYERIFGYAPEEVVGRAMIELVHPDDRERTLQAATGIMAGEPQPHFQNRYIRKDGKIVHVMWAARWSERDQARIAIGRDVTGLKQAEARQAALYAISEAASAEGDLLALFGRIHHIIGGLMPARNLFVALHDEQHDELSFPYFVDEHDPQPAPRPLDSGTLSAEVIRSGQALLLAADSDAPELLSRIMGSRSLDWLGVPLKSPERTIGALVVQSYDGDVRYTHEHKALLQFVSDQVAAAILRKQAERWLHHVARHDPLTGLANRTLFHDSLQSALAEVRGGDARGVGLLYIDLDGFKQVNDNHGHPVGDLLLQAVAQRIRHCVRDTDTVGRIGGDEFVVLLRGLATPAQAATIAEKIRNALDKTFDLSGHPLRISSSIGIATCPEHGDDHKQLVRHADEAMYSAKKTGGNRLLVASAG